MIHEILVGIFVLAFLVITLEEKILMNKAKSALFFGTFAWVVLFIIEKFFGNPSVLEHSFEENILEIALLWFFLISAMTFVAYMDKRGFIERKLCKYLPAKLSEKKLLFIIGIFAFFLSSIADNLTSTLVALTALLALNLDRDKLIRYAVFVVFSANAGGVFLITGDITTLMLFLGGKVEMTKLIWMVIPSFISFIVLYFLLSRGLDGEVKIKKEVNNSSRIDSIIAVAFLLTIVAIILGNVFLHIPPVLTFLFGLSVMLLLGWLYKRVRNHDLKVFEYIRAIEFDSLFFFLGVLLLVGMLKEIGVLERVIDIYTIIPAHYSSFIVGILSAFVDNIPLTAAMIKSGISLSEAGWLTLNYAVGVGGSLLVIGSAAGVVAMGKVKGLTFGRYLRYSVYILIAYTIGFIGTYFTSNLIV